MRNITVPPGQLRLTPGGGGGVSGGLPLPEAPPAFPGMALGMEEEVCCEGLEDGRRAGECNPNQGRASWGMQATCFAPAGEDRLPWCQGYRGRRGTSGSFLPSSQFKRGRRGGQPSPSLSWQLGKRRQKQMRELAKQDVTRTGLRGAAGEELSVFTKGEPAQAAKAFFPAVSPSR